MYSRFGETTREMFFRRVQSVTIASFPCRSISHNTEPDALHFGESIILTGGTCESKTWLLSCRSLLCMHKKAHLTVHAALHEKYIETYTYTHFHTPPPIRTSQYHAGFGNAAC